MASTKRPLKDIQAENHQLVYRAGQLQYQLRQFAKDLEAINDRLVSINVEGAEAIELEKQVAEKMAAEKAKEAEAKANAEGATTTPAEQSSPAPVEVASSQTKDSTNV